jgi:hypothetical protein
VRLTIPQSDKRGKPWTLRVVKRAMLDGEEVWGLCDYPKREIVLSQETRLHGVSREILLHEFLHKIMPWLTEEAVEHTAAELDAILDFAEHRNILDI